MGDLTTDMTDNYTHFDKDSYRENIEIQKKILNCNTTPGKNKDFFSFAILTQLKNELLHF